MKETILDVFDMLIAIQMNKRMSRSGTADDIIETLFKRFSTEDFEEMANYIHDMDKFYSPKKPVIKKKGE